MSNGFDACDKHTYLFATGVEDCPYCEIDRLKEELKFEKFSAKHNEKVVKERISEVRQLQAELAVAGKIWTETAEQNERLKQQLAEARAEINRRDEFCGKCENGQLVALEQARQEAARECYDNLVFGTIGESRERIAEHFGLFELEG